MTEEAAQQAFTFTLQTGGTTPAFLGIGSNSTHQLDIFDDDIVPQVGFNNTTVSISENSISVSLQVDYNGAVGALSIGDAIQVTYTTSDITAQDGSDFDFSGASPINLDFVAGTANSRALLYLSRMNPSLKMMKHSL